MVESGREPLDLAGQAGLALQRPFRELAQGFEARARIGFDEEHVETQRAGLLALHDFGGQPRHLVAAPGPLPEPLQARVIDVDDDDGGSSVPGRVARSRTS